MLLFKDKKIEKSDCKRIFYFDSIYKHVALTRMRECVAHAKPVEEW